MIRPTLAKESVMVDTPLFRRLSISSSLTALTLAFIAAVLIAILAVSELAARDSVAAAVSARLNALRSDYVNRSRPGDSSPQVPAPSASAASLADAARQAYLPLSAGQILTRIEATEDLRRLSQKISLLGASNGDPPLSQILSELNSFNPDLGTVTGANEVPPWIRTVGRLQYEFRAFSSDQLLAIAMVTCGALGALTLSIRQKERFRLHSLLVGLSTGFVAYLAIKGGKHLFLLQTSGELVAFNPYGSALAALLAGLFSEKANQLLTSVVDDFAHRVKAATGRPGGEA